MKYLSPALALLLAAWLVGGFFAAPSQASPDPLYSPLAHVPARVANCVAALNRWIKQNHHYDALAISDGQLMRAATRHSPRIFSAGQPVPVDAVVALKASAKLRATWRWNPVTARCGVRHDQPVAFSLTPRLRH